MTEVGKCELYKIIRISTHKVNESLKITRQECKFIFTGHGAYKVEKIMKHDHQHTQALEDVRVSFREWVAGNERLRIH